MTWTKRGIVVVLTGAILPVTLGCSFSGSPPKATAGADRTATAQGPMRSIRPVESCAAKVYSRMTQVQRVGQLFIVGIASYDPAANVARPVDTYHFGSLLFTGDYTRSVSATRAATRRMQALATTKATAGARFLIGANQEGGQIQQLAGPGFSAMPSALAQGGLSVSGLRRSAEVWGRELRSAGLNLDLAPVMDVVPAATASENQPIGALGREFGYSPGTVAAHGAAFIEGMRSAGIATTAKHFPGLGRVVGNTDFTSRVVDSTTTAGDPYLASFQEAINIGVPFVMVSLATYTRIDPDHMAAFSSKVMTGLLRDRMRFGGVIMSDDLGQAAAVADMSPGRRAVDFLDAGGDLITSQDLGPAISMEYAVLGRAATDASFRSVVATAVLRVLDAKQALGLLPC